MSGGDDADARAARLVYSSRTGDTRAVVVGADVYLHGGWRSGYADRLVVAIRAEVAREIRDAVAAAVAPYAARLAAAARDARAVAADLADWPHAEDCPRADEYADHSQGCWDAAGEATPPHEPDDDHDPGPACWAHVPCECGMEPARDRVRRLLAALAGGASAEEVGDGEA